MNTKEKEEVEKEKETKESLWQFGDKQQQQKQLVVLYSITIWRAERVI